MEFINRIHQELKEAQLGKQELRVSVLRLLLASLNNREIEKRTKLSKSASLEELDELSRLTEEESLEGVASEAKKRREAIAGFNQGGRRDSAKKEEDELQILEAYLPEAISEEEVRKMIVEAIARTGAKAVGDSGRVMKDLMPEIKKRGRADGSLVSQAVKELLSQNQE